MNRIVRALGMGAVTLTAMGSSAMAADRDCAGLKSLALADVTITAAERIEPGWKFPPSVFNLFLGPNAVARKSVCRVAATIEKEIRIEVWLPDDWNGRFQGVGNGGLTGAINYGALATGVGEGYATASTDTGHVTPNGFFEAEWVDGHPDRVENFGHRGHHMMAVRAKEIVTAYYSKAPHHSYFTGCSSGGWQGLSEAQRYPADYDGIYSSAPAINFVKLQSGPLIQAQMSLKDPSSVLTVAHLTALADAAVKHCDAKDGVTDGLIDDPRNCDFDPGTLACKPGETSATCLNPAQVARARASIGPQRSRGGMKLYPGLAWGTPPFAGDLGPTGGDLMIVRALKSPPSWTLATFDPDRDIAPMEAEIGGILDSMNPDLSAFRGRGGKLILHHGWADPLLSPYHTLEYYGDVQTAMGGDSRDFLRLFMAPGMAHCAGGAGPNSFDALSAVVAWVEKGIAPERIVASHRTSPAPNAPSDRTRPLCVYPKVARYKGSGSIDDEANFTCADPR